MLAVVDLKPGDRVVAVNGAPLPEPRVVEYVDGFGSAWLLALPGQVTEHRLYNDQHEVEVEPVPVPEPAPVPEAVVVVPPKPRRRPRKVVEGVTLISQGDGRWTSEDERYGVQREEGQTTCDDAHPMRLAPHLVEWAQRNPGDIGSGAILWAVRLGKRGYLCPGFADHTYPVWTAWAGDWADETTNTMAEALDALASMIRRGDDA